MLGVATATSKPRRRLASETEGTEEPASKRRRTESSNEGDTPAASFGETLLEADADAKELEDELDAELDDMFGGRRRIVPRNAARNAPRRSLPKPPPESLGNRSDSIINGNYGNERKPSSIAPKLASKFGR